MKASSPLPLHQALADRLAYVMFRRESIFKTLFLHCRMTDGSYYQWDTSIPQLMLSQRSYRKTKTQVTTWSTPLLHGAFATIQELQAALQKEIDDAHRAAQSPGAEPSAVRPTGSDPEGA